jgi:LuxR family maltose regulon positive regulatory protein
MNNTEKSLALDHLSERELEILRLIEQGCTNREIAQRLVLSFETIKWYNKQIYSKLGVNNRIQAVTAAKAAGLIGLLSDFSFR